MLGKRIRQSTCTTVVLTLIFTGVVQAAPPAGFLYQGQLKDGSTPANGAYDFEFTLWDALTGGHQVGAADVQADVQVAGGLFTVRVNEAGQFGSNALNGDERWLQIAVAQSGGHPTVLTPRQPLKGAPYALTALSTVGVDGHSLDAADGDPTDSVFVDNSGRVGVNTLTPGYTLHVVDTTGSAAVYAENPSESMYGELASERGGVYGEGATAVRGVSNAGTGKAVWGSNIATSGNAIGVYGSTASATGFAGWFDGMSYFNGNVGVGTTSPASPLTVAGLIESTTGGFRFPDGTTQTTAATGGGDSFWQEAGSGIYYQAGNVGVGTNNPTYPLHARGSDPVVIAAYNLSLGADGQAIWAETAATNASAVVGRNGSTTGTTKGLYGIALSPDGEAVRGTNTATTGAALGVSGQTNSVDGIGVYGMAYATSGTNYGVYGETRSSSGFGGYFDGRGYFSGDVGIGTETPTSPLTVAGQIESTSGGFRFPDGTTQTTAAGGGFWQGTTTGIYYIDGNVGLGNVSVPSSALHVTKNSPDSALVTVYNTSSANTGTGISCQTDAISSAAVFGRANSTSGENWGVYGLAYSPDGKGVQGRNLSTTGDAIGVHGVTDSTSGIAVYGHAQATSGFTYGIYGKVDSTLGYAGYFDGRTVFTDKVGIGTTNPGAPLDVVKSGGGSAIKGENSGSYATAVYGFSQNPTGPCFGVRGESDSASGIGVKGAANSPSGVNVGVQGISESPDGRAIEGTNTDGGWAGYFQGAAYVSGDVGIGTESPMAKLDVAGTAKMTGFQLSTAPTAGYVLTCDGSGNGTWQPPGGAFDLPYDGSVSYAGPAFKLTNSSTDPNAVGGWFESGAQQGDGLYGLATGTYASGIRAEATGGDATALTAIATGGNGVAVSAKTNSGSQPAIVARNYNGGPLFRGRNSPSNTVFEVTNDGTTIVSILQIQGGSDLSEQFDVRAAKAEPEPGMVVCIDADNPGKLVVSTQAYDRKVAGIVSGAGDVKPGMLMGQNGSVADGQLPVALTGRVYVRADASNGPIEPGDLLTTSDVPGHAMRVTDYARAHGAIIGKAMTSLPSGDGLVLVLVALQ